MVELIAIPATLLGLYALWIVGRNDALRVIQGVRHVRARVVRHHSGPDGFTAIYAFQHRERTCEVPAQTAFAAPSPQVGDTVMLSYPAKRPDLARDAQPLARFLLYALFAGWIVLFSDLWLNWL